jgi:hypothetical protein
MPILPVGVDIWRISDPTGAGAIFHLRVRPAPASLIGGCGHGFHFSPVGDPQISEISNFDGFDLVSPPKYPLIPKFWPRPIISPTQVMYRNPRWHLSYSPTPFFLLVLQSTAVSVWHHVERGGGSDWRQMHGRGRGGVRSVR